VAWVPGGRRLPLECHFEQCRRPYRGRARTHSGCLRALRTSSKCLRLLQPLRESRFFIPNSRYYGVEQYISSDWINRPEYSDLSLPYDESIYSRLREHGLHLSYVSQEPKAKFVLKAWMICSPSTFHTSSSVILSSFSKKLWTRMIARLLLISR
jgi:hypothetical protein